MNRYLKSDLESVKKDLLNGQIIAFPTDTVFGLGCLYGDQKAIDKIYEAKNRSIDKKLPIMVSSVEMIEEYVEVGEGARKLIEAFMPGAITLIFKYKDKDETVAIRMPDDEFILSLIDGIGKPLHVTSANLSGRKSLMNYHDVIYEIGRKIDGVVIGDAKGDVASTIVNCVDNFKIIREGLISSADINRVLGREE